MAVSHERTSSSRITLSGISGTRPVVSLASEIIPVRASRPCPSLCLWWPDAEYRGAPVAGHLPGGHLSPELPRSPGEWLGAPGHLRSRAGRARASSSSRRSSSRGVAARFPDSPAPSSSAQTSWARVAPMLPELPLRTWETPRTFPPSSSPMASRRSSSRRAASSRNIPASSATRSGSLSSWRERRVSSTAGSSGGATSGASGPSAASTAKVLSAGVIQRRSTLSSSSAFTGFAT